MSTNPSGSAGMNLHGQIMNLTPTRLGPSDAPLAYKYGHRDARHAAAELAMKADAINALMLEALRNLECAANTVDYCYTRKPERFAEALRDLREYAEAARAAIAAATAGAQGEQA